MHFHRYTTNAHGKHTRYATLQGRQYLVAPVVMLVEGVHNGSRGALYYPPEEMERAAMAWNMKPVVVYHPSSGSAATVTELENRMVGFVMNTKWEGGKLRAEAWLDPERLADIAHEVIEALEMGNQIEVSTGLYHDADPTPGTWNGEAYDFVARNHRPDHLALLPVGVGACNLADGCGLLQLNQEQNEMNTFDEEPLIAPTMNFGNDEPMPGPEEPLVAPTMKFGTGCGCGGTGTVGGGDVAAAALPQPWPVPDATPANNNATGGDEGGETPLMLPTTA